MKKSVQILILILLAMSCKDDLGNTNAAMDVDLNLYVSVFDKSGTDLLDSSQVNSIDVSKMRRFYLDETGNKVEFFQSNLTYPRGIAYMPKMKESIIKVNLLIFAIYGTGDHTTTYIQWNDTKTDTITADIMRVESSIWAANIHYNGIPIDDKIKEVYNEKGMGYYPIVWE